MKLHDSAAEEVSIEVGVYLGGGDGGMTEHFLNGAEVGAAFDEVCGKGVSEGVRTDGLFQPYFGGTFFDDIKHHDAR